jgi:tRNA (cytidine/uridine-2'-O-)-methyltransferase
MAFQKERRVLQVKLVVPFVFGNCFTQDVWQQLYYFADSMIRVALVEPEIPPNTGNIARLCAANRVSLHIVGVPGFRLDDRAVRRAGLDYWPEVDLQRHLDLDALYRSLPEARFIYLSTKAEKNYADWAFEPNDCLVFGRETRGLPDEVLQSNWDRCLTIPMLNPTVRSLNLATAVGIVLYAALQQTSAFGR